MDTTELQQAVEVVAQFHERQWTGLQVDSHSGIPVTHNSAMMYSSVYSAVSRIASDVSSLSLNDIVIDDDGDEIVQRTSGIQWILNDEPNELMTAQALRETITSHALLLGNGYAGIARDGAGRPIMLVPLTPDRVKVHTINNQVIYEVKNRHDDGSPAEPDVYQANQMIHIAGLAYDGVRGYSIISLARNSFGLGLAGERHGNRHFKNNATPSVVLKTPGKLDKAKAEQYLSDWEERQSGDNSGRPALLTGEWEITALPSSNDASQWLQSRAFQKTEVAQWFHIPPHLLGDTEKLSYKSIEAENRAYLNQTLRKWLCRWECEGKRKLYPERVRRLQRRRLKHDTSQLISADIETRANVATLLRGAEIITGNEARVSMGYNRIDDPDADRLSNPNTRRDNESAPASDPPEPTPDSTQESQVDAAFRKLITGEMAKFIGVEQKKISKAALEEGNFMEWLDDYYGAVTSTAEARLAPIVDAYAAATERSA